MGSTRCSIDSTQTTPFIRNSLSNITFCLKLLLTLTLKEWNLEHLPATLSVIGPQCGGTLEMHSESDIMTLFRRAPAHTGPLTTRA